MDPEIQRALNDGVPPAAIAAELTRRGLAVPPELQSMIQPAGPSAQEKLRDYGTAAALGAGAAGTLGGAGYGGYQAFSPKQRSRRLLTQAVKESGGPQALKDVLNQFQAAGRGGMVTLGDLSPRMGAAADFVATNSPSARTALSKIHQERQAGVPTRIAGDLEGQIGYQAPNYLKGLVEQSQADFGASDLGYQGLRDRNPAIAPAAVPKLQAFIDSPKLTKVWQQAAEVGGIGPMPKADALSFEVLQDMKERMDDAVGHAFASGRGPLGARLAAARDQLVDAMADAIPDFKPVAGQYHTFSKQKEMLQAGQDSWHAPMQLADLEMTMRELSPSDRAAFRRGMAGAVFQDIENAKTNTNLAKQMLAGSAVTEKKLETVFGSRQKFQAFYDRLQLEKQMSAMGEIVGGSATARRLGQQADVADQIMEGADAVMHPVRTATHMAKNGPEYFAGPVARRLETDFTTQGYRNLRRILDALK